MLLTDRLPELDGLRGIAILLVLFFHFNMGLKLGVAPFGYGWSGVDLFFVLSGFLITTILLNTKDSSQYFKSFYVRRVLRIFPLYYLALALYFFVQVPLHISRGEMLPVGWPHQLWYWLYFVNWRDVTNGMLPGIEHLWSLSVEEQFYLVWPLAIWLCPRKWVATLCSVTIAGSLVSRLVFELRGVDSEFLHRATINRLDTLAFGALVAAVTQNTSWRTWLRGQLKLIAPTACLLLIVLCAADRAKALPVPFTLYYLVFAVIYACLVFYGADQTGTSTWLCRILRLPPLRSFGKYSYSIYLFHGFVQSYLGERIYFSPYRAKLRFIEARWIVFFIFIACAYLIGVFTWHAFEKHLLSLKRYFSYTNVTVGPSIQDSGIEIEGVSPDLAQAAGRGADSISGA